MKQGSVRKRIILLYTLSILLLFALAAVFLFVTEDRVITEAAKENLASLTEDAVADLEAAGGTMTQAMSIRYYMDGTYLIICSENGEILSGEIPRGFENEVPFERGQIRQVRCKKRDFYIYDVPVEQVAGTVIWVRGIAPAQLKEISPTLYSMSRLFILVLPLLIAAAAFAGWYVTRRAFAPLGRIVDTAASIHEGTDLSRRIGIGSVDSEDEILRTAGVFDQMLERIQESFERERHFTNNASHELRTPVAVIMSQSEYALSHSGDEEVTRKALENIRLHSRKMRDLISRLLFLARADSGRQKIRPEKMDIGLCAEESAAMLSQEAAAKAISVNVESEEGIYISGDEMLISQMFSNLISNGIKYGKKGGWVKVRIRSDRSVVTIRIDDNGRGMDAEETGHIWERFYRGAPPAEDTSGKGSDDSTGLGLPITKWIVEAHGGSISVFSLPGEGTCFKITLKAWKEGER